MPTYEYECKSCGSDFDVFQSMADDPLKACPTCGNGVRRKISKGTGIIFKGSGFYKTDSRKSSSASSGSSSQGDSSVKADSTATTDSTVQGDSAAKNDSAAKSDSAAKGDSATKGDSVPRPAAASTSSESPKKNPG